MITAIVLVQAEPGKVPQLAQQLLEIPQVSEVYSVAGEYDLVALVRVARHEQLADLVPRNIDGLAGISRTYTLIAFEAFSRHDLESMWSVGLEEEIEKG